MTSVVYTAKREIISGHSVGTDYGIDFDDPQQLDRSASITKDVHTSIGGDDETILHRHTFTWDFTTGFIASSSMPALREFIHSCEAGEIFVWDPYGTVAVPDDPINATLDMKGYKEIRVGQSSYFYVQLKVKEA